MITKNKELNQLMALEYTPITHADYKDLIIKSGNLIFDKFEEFGYPERSTYIGQCGYFWQPTFRIWTSTIAIQVPWGEGAKDITIVNKKGEVCDNITFINAYIKHSKMIYKFIRKEILRVHQYELKEAAKLQTINPEIYLLEAEELLKGI